MTGESLGRVVHRTTEAVRGQVVSRTEIMQVIRTCDPQILRALAQSDELIAAALEGRVRDGAQDLSISDVRELYNHPVGREVLDNTLARRGWEGREVLGSLLERATSVPQPPAPNACPGFCQVHHEEPQRPQVGGFSRFR